LKHSQVFLFAILVVLIATSVVSSDTAVDYHSTAGNELGSDFFIYYISLSEDACLTKHQMGREMEYILIMLVIVELRTLLLQGRVPQFTHTKHQI